MTSAHPPFAHNPHVYNGIDPDADPTTSMVVTSRAVTGHEDEAAHPDAESDDDAPVDVDGDGQVTGREALPVS